MPDLQGRTLFITGASRGIGKAIGLRAARDGANVVVAAKTAAPHPTLPGTIYTAAEEMQRAGGRALPVLMNVRDETQIARAVELAAGEFGGIDILVNNASALYLTGTRDTPAKRFDLMHNVAARGTFLCTQHCLPHLERSTNPHVLNIAPPLNFEARWFQPHLAYSLAKYGMSLCVLGMAEEFRAQGVAVNALWPRTVIYTAAVAMLQGMVKPENCRTSEIVADAAHAILTRDSRTCSGHFFIDEEILQEEGVTDFSPYAVDPNGRLLPDLFLD